METGLGFITWTILLLSNISTLRGESTASTPALTSDLTINEVISIAVHATQKNSTAETHPDNVREFTPHSETKTMAFPSPSDVSTHSLFRMDTSPTQTATYTPDPGHSTETTEAFLHTSPSLTSVRSSAITPGSITLTSTSQNLSEKYETSTHQSTISASEKSPFSTAPTLSLASTLTAPTATGHVPLDNPHQEGASELDVGDEGKVPHASPWDPLLAALVSIFIVSTALVSVMLFLKFRQQSEHPEFHRLQDLPMDDLLEDTPLSRYSY
ncbi:uncharacterized protein si:ch73-344o19.1 [Hoplias malabaricus]|uniref:uncharacterized protein si:ch73-344o19.1 n=1 Tax=Hoplias malabaricus TaxID=27720 RepID=UPI0034620287